MPESLAKKLRLRIGQKITVLNRPNGAYFAGFEVIEKIPPEPTDIVVLFVKTLDELKEKTTELIESNSLKLSGRLLIAYPKKGNPAFESYIHRDAIFPALGVEEDGYIKDSDYKFNLMVKLDEIYTIVGIKREKRVEKTVERD